MTMDKLENDCVEENLNNIDLNESSNIRNKHKNNIVNDDENENDLVELNKKKTIVKKKRRYDANGFRIRQPMIDAVSTNLLDHIERTGTYSDKDKNLNENKNLNKIKLNENGCKVISIADEIAQGAQYIIDGSLRRVPPYYFTYFTYCKERWRNRPLLDIFVKEFRDRDKEYYEWVIKKGLVMINNKSSSVDTIVKNGDVISHRCHRHEPAVSSNPIKIVAKNDNIIAIDKPSGLPVHPTGRYKFNTVTEIFKHEYGMIVHPCNRLDRLTSGLMFMAQNSKAAAKFAESLRNKTVHKEYIAKVWGEFPYEKVTCDEPIITVDPKLGLNRVLQQGGKESKTEFVRISYDPSTNMSVVKCMPKTGRTHQIRVHLQFLGYPIANDPIYANRRVWGLKLGKGGDGNNDEIIEKLDRMGKTEEAQSIAFEEIVGQWKKSRGEKLLGKKCPECKTDLYSDPAPTDLTLWLHAYKYSSSEDGWTYETEMPEWALPGYNHLNSGKI